MFAVPSLSELKRMSGRTATLSPGLLIETMVANGELPATNDCAGCGAGTVAAVDVIAICERARSVGDNSEYWTFRILLFLAFGWIGLIIARLNRPPSDERVVGTDRDVRMPLRICADCQILRLRKPPYWPFLVIAAVVVGLGVAVGYYAENVLIAVATCVAGLAVAIIGRLWTQRQFRNGISRLLRDEPAYGRLLEQYPNAQFVILGRERAIPSRT
jgi:hypothetical protein